MTDDPVLQSAARIGGIKAPSLGGVAISGECLDRVHGTYLAWFGENYDLGALDAVLATAAAERLDGDPPWLLVVGGSGAAKTETLMPLQSVGAIIVSTLSGEAALLSGTPKKDIAADANGGLLARLGPRGILVIKDFTSILSMSRDARAQILAALREIYDGHWTRDVGAEGGRELRWRGRVIVIGAVTTAWDSAHQVIATMGDRFPLVRIGGQVSSAHRRAAGLRAMKNVAAEVEMREDLAQVVAKLLDSVDPDTAIDLNDDEHALLLDAADLVTQARTAVHRDRQGGPAFAHALEYPTRYAKQLAQFVRGGVAIGMSRDAAMGVALRVARDSMPPLRLSLLADIAAHPQSFTSDSVKRLQLPRQTVDRALQELHLLGLLTVNDRITADGRVRWVYELADDSHRAALETFTRNGRPR